MHFLVAFVVVIALWSTELIREDAVRSEWNSIAVTLGGILALSALSFIISLVRQRNYFNNVGQGTQAESSKAKYSERIFIGCWLCTCFLVFGIGQWGNLVRSSWNLDKTFLLDELLIIAPILLPLCIHWWIQSGVGICNKSRKRLNKIRTRLGYVGIRVQIYFALTLIPMVVLWAACDLTQLLPDQSNEGAKWAMLLLALAIATIFFPWLLVLIWPNRKISDQNLRHRIEQVCREKKLRISDVRVWQTGSQVTNAMVAGFFWPCRILWLSDGLLETSGCRRVGIGHPP